MSLSKSFFKNLIERDEKLRLDFLKRQSLENSISTSQCFADSSFQNIYRELSNMISSETLDRNHLDELLIKIFHENYQNIEVANSHELELASQIDINKLEKAKRVLEGNIMHPPTQKELAEEVLMSESKLRKDFKKYYGITIHDFLTQIRMQKARIYLLVDQLTVYEVASLTGYGHQNNFSYAFRKFFGYPPRDLKV
jgi:transcriptional regulator GlxA family with amidase domain